MVFTKTTKLVSTFYRSIYIVNLVWHFVSEISSPEYGWMAFFMLHPRVVHWHGMAASTQPRWSLAPCTSATMPCEVNLSCTTLPAKQDLSFILFFCEEAKQDLER
jgi:hypothetical protein